MHPPYRLLRGFHSLNQINLWNLAVFVVLQNHLLYRACSIKIDHAFGRWESIAVGESLSTKRILSVDSADWLDNRYKPLFCSIAWNEAVGGFCRQSRVFHPSDRSRRNHLRWGLER